MTLKTLKDLDVWENELCKVALEEVKEEAIKWILDSLKKKKNPYNSFMEFHNISEEDLK